jgi:hypothetical protein
MDILFNCPHCQQELQVEASAAGSEIECPACSKSLTVPAATPENTVETPAAGEETTTPPEEQENQPAAQEEQANEAEESAAPHTLTLPRGGTPPPPAAPKTPAPTHAVAPSKHFVVPVHSTPAEVLITKASKPLEIAAQESDKKLRIKTIRRSECLEVGRDHFDEKVSAFLDKVGQPNVISVTAVHYSIVDASTHQAVSDYGIMILFKG